MLRLSIGERGLLHNARGISSVTHNALIRPLNKRNNDRKTAIICTVGPATDTPEMISKLLYSGMNVMRLNFSHGPHEAKAKLIGTLREELSIIRSSGKPIDFEDGRLEDICAIAGDTKGPEIRTGLFDPEATGGASTVALEQGQQLVLTTDEAMREKGSPSQIFVDHAALTGCLTPGTIVFVDDGLITLHVDAVSPDEGTVTCTVKNKALLGQQKGINIPGVTTGLPSLTEQDKKDLRFCVTQGVDMVFASFIRRAEDVHAVRDVLGNEGRHIKVISKIENLEGVENFDEILDASDGIMVARGDLGIEIPPEKVFLAQKMMISKANIVGKTAICATQMLESMTENPRPTRAEVSDVANAVMDGADAVMLSGETAKGKYPLEAVSMMGRVCQEAESAIDYPDLFESTKKAVKKLREMPGMFGFKSRQRSEVESIAAAAVTASLEQDADMIVVLTNNGGSAAAVAKYRPKAPILVMTSDEVVANQSQIHRGCQSILLNSVASQYLAVHTAMDKARELGIAGSSSRVVVVCCHASDNGFRETLEIMTME